MNREQPHECEYEYEHEYAAWRYSHPLLYPWRYHWLRHAARELPRVLRAAPGWFWMLVVIDVAALLDLLSYLMEGT